MKRKMRTAHMRAVRQLCRTSLLLLFLASLVVACADATPASSLANAKSVTPFAADSFVDAVGINTHFSYSDTPYARNWEQSDPTQNIRSLLTELGIRHVRDRIPNSQLQPAIAYARPRLAELYRDFGMRFIAGVDTRKGKILDPSQMAPYLDEFANGSINLKGGNIPIREMLEAVEGINEYDNHNHPSKRDPNWATNLKNYQSQLYRSVKANPLLAQLPVVMPSLVYTKYCTDKLGSLAGIIDLGNLHSYPNYPYFQRPSQNLSWHIGYGKKCYGNSSVYATETGYQSGIDGISDRTIAKYTSRLLAEYFLSGQIKRTYLYELVDTLPSAGNLWGLIRPQKNGRKKDGFDQFTLTPKPSYYAVKSLLDLLREGEWMKTQRQWNAPAITLKPVKLSLQGEKGATHHLLLQKSTGDYFLLLWQEVESFNPKAGNFEPAVNEVKVSVAADYTLQDLYEYDEQFKYKRTSLANAGNQATIRVPDSVAVVHFKTSSAQ